MTAAGLLNPQPAYYWLKTAIALGTVAGCLALALLVESLLVRVLAGALLGFASTQVALLAHDIGHRQAFRGRRHNLVASALVGNLLLGVSFSWWTVKHNQHHATPNHVESDPDILFPMIAFDESQIGAKSRWLRPVIAVQAWVFAALLPFQALAMYVNSVGHLLSPRAKLPWLQAAGMAVHWALYGWFLFALGSWEAALAVFAAHQFVFGTYNSSVFASNHKGMPVIRPGERLDFLREQVITSRNVDAHPLVDFWYGGLNHQIEHHLFPTMPRNRLAEARAIVRPFCDARGISYVSTSLLASYREAFRHLDEVGASARQPG